MAVALAQKAQAVKQDFKLLLCIMILLGVDILVTYPSTAIYVVIGALAFTLTKIKIFHSKRRLISTLLAIIGGFLIIFAWSEPSQALLLQSVQTHFAEIISQGTGSANYGKMTNLIFNTARVAYIIFMMVVVWQGFQETQQQGEMGQLVRVGLYSVLAVLSVDVVSQFVVA